MAVKKGGASEADNEKVKISVRINKLLRDEEKTLKAFASATIGPFAVHGIRVFEKETENGKELFVGMPQNSYKTSSGETIYEDLFHPITANSREELCNAVADAYEQALSEQESMDNENNQSKTNTVEFEQKL